DVVLGDQQSAVDTRQRKRIWFVGDFHEQRAQHRQGQGQLQIEMHPLPRLGDRPHRASGGVGHVMHYIEADATSRNLRDLFFGGKRRQKQKLQQLRFRQRGGHVGRGQLFAQDLPAQVL